MLVVVVGGGGGVAVVVGVVVAFPAELFEGHPVSLSLSLSLSLSSEPVWLSGKALGWEAEGPRFESASAFLSLQ